MAGTAPSKLFTPLQVGRIGKLSHRVVLAPLTRNRATEPDLSPGASLTALYYRQRASPGGLLITEATHVSPESLAYPSTPGIWSSQQVEGWKTVTEAVHDEGGFLVCQLWHTGRVAHPSFGQHPCNAGRVYQPCVSSSAVPIANPKGRRARTVTYEGIQEHGVPRALTTDDLARLCEDYARAASNAMEAGFDGVELHGAHGYLLDQFLNNRVNQRTDGYGGSIENRCRLLQEVLDAILGVWPADKVGVRLSPHDGQSTYYDCNDDNPDELYSHAVSVLNNYNLAYLLLTEPRWVMGKHDGDHATDPGFRMPLRNLHEFRGLYRGTLIGAGGFTPKASFREMGDYDALAWGRWFIANPDLPERLRAWHEHEQNGTPPPPMLNRYDRDTFYTQQAEGYTDYPSLEFEQQEGASSSKPKWEGMVAGKYPLVDPAHVGTSLKATDEKRSKL